jgi:hypothetical protein
MGTPLSYFITADIGVDGAVDASDWGRQHLTGTGEAVAAKVSGVEAADTSSPSSPASTDSGPWSCLMEMGAAAGVAATASREVSQPLGLWLRGRQQRGVRGWNGYGAAVYLGGGGRGE